MNVRGPEKRGRLERVGRPVARHRGRDYRSVAPAVSGITSRVLVSVARQPASAAAAPVGSARPRAPAAVPRRRRELRRAPPPATPRPRRAAVEPRRGAPRAGACELCSASIRSSRRMTLRASSTLPRLRLGIARVCVALCRILRGTCPHIRAGRRAGGAATPPRPTASVIQLHWKTGRSAPSTMPTTSSRQRRRRMSSARLGSVIPLPARGRTSCTCGRGRRPRRASSSATTRSSREPSSSVSTRARRTASSARAPGPSPSSSARSAMRRSSRSRAVSPRSTAARIAAAHGPSSHPSSVSSASRSSSERCAPAWKSASSQRSSASSSVVGRVGQPRLQLDDERRAEDVEPGRLARRHLRGGRRHRPDAVGPEVEPLEDDGAGGDRARRREPKRADGPPELPGSVGNAAGLRVELGLQLEDERAVDLPTPVPRQQPAGVRPGGGELVRGGRPYAHAAAEVGRSPGGQADERREGRVRAPVAVEGALELAVGALEGVVVPVEAAARLGGGDEQRDQDRAPEGLVLADPLVGVGAGEDSGGRLVLERRERLARVLAQGEPAARCSMNEPTSGRYSYRVGRFGPACSSSAIGRSAPPSSSSPRSKKAPRQKPRSAVKSAGSAAPCRHPGLGCRLSKGRSDTRNGYAPAGLVPSWQPGHQYAIRASSPCGNERIRPPQRRARTTGAAVDQVPPHGPPCIRRAASPSTRRRAASSSSESGRQGDIPRREERLRPPHVSDAGDQALVEQGLADRPRLARGAEARDHAVEVGWVRHHVGAEPGHRGRPAAGQLEHRAVPEHGLALAAAQDEPRRPARLVPGRPRPASARACAGGCGGRGRLRSRAGGSCRPLRPARAGARRAARPAAARRRADAASRPPRPRPRARAGARPPGGARRPQAPRGPCEKTRSGRSSSSASASGHDRLTPSPAAR